MSSYAFTPNILYSVRSFRGIYGGFTEARAMSPMVYICRACSLRAVPGPTRQKSVRG